MAAAKKANVGTLIKEARTAAGLSQEKLAAGIDGLSTADIGKAERGEKELTKDQLKAIAKATGVTQKSLLEAPAGGTASSASKKDTGSGKGSGTAAGKGSGQTAKKEEEFKLTATEKKLVELYRAADTNTKKTALSLLKGEPMDIMEALSAAGILKPEAAAKPSSGKTQDGSELIGSLLESALGSILKK